MEELREFLAIVFLWPAAVVVCVILLRGPIVKLINRLLDSESGKAKVGPIEVELGKLAAKGQEAVNKLNKLTI